MRKRTHSYLVGVSCGFALTLLIAGPLQADQIVSVTDEHGHQVYINTGESTTRLDWVARSFRSAGRGAPPPPSPEINRLVEQTADRHKVDPQLVHAIIRAESEYNPNAISRKGAMGLMQLIPATAQRFGVDNPFDPRQNIEGGVNYLKYLLELFRGDLTLSLAAYNAGEHSVLRSGRIPAFAETRDYIRKVTRFYGSGSSLTPSQNNGKEPEKSPITRYVDAQGVVHFSNVE